MARKQCATCGNEFTTSSKLETNCSDECYFIALGGQPSDGIRRYCLDGQTIETEQQIQARDPELLARLKSRKSVPPKKLDPTTTIMTKYSPKRLLPPETVEAIEKSNLSPQMLADAYDVSLSNVYKIKRGKYIYQIERQKALVEQEGADLLLTGLDVASSRS